MLVPTGLVRFAVAIAGTVLFAMASAHAQGIDGSLHDLATGTGDNNEICVYCHTPHGAAAATTIEAPLWNKPVVATTYQTYDSTTIDGDILAVGSVSLACLTCHDGTQARDAVINAPGSGLGTSPLGTLGTMPVGITNLGTDLTNDHPIGIQYGGFGATPTDPDFKTDTTPPTNNLELATINGLSRWWVDTSVGTGGTREKTDIILYTRDNTGNPGGLAEEPFVECASCHDPHNNANGTFLRISNANSDVCLACHVK
jgi:predicted CXXCH cytochrome family protein